MSTTVQELYQRVCWDHLEDDGLVLGIVTPAEFLNYLSEAIVEFCEQVGMVKNIFTQTIFSAQPQYLIPDPQYKVVAAFIAGVWLEPTTLEELYNSQYEWPNDVGQPQWWFQDGLPEGTVQLVPVPDFNGTVIPGPQPPYGAYGEFNPSENNLTTVGTAGPNPITLTLSDTIPSVVPDSFTPYLVYRILWKMASMDGEAKDLQRARYCEARWKEGISLAQSIMMEAVVDK